MSFNPQDPPIDAEMWKPSSDLQGLALRRCDWVGKFPVDAIEDAQEWLRAIIVGCYYQGLSDGVKHMARKQRAKEAKNANP